MLLLSDFLASKLNLGKGKVGKLARIALGTPANENLGSSRVTAGMARGISFIGGLFLVSDLEDLCSQDLLLNLGNDFFGATLCTGGGSAKA